MSNIEESITSLHDRLDALRRGFDGEFSAAFTELDRARLAAEEIRQAGSGNDRRLRQLEERAEGQSELIETLTQEAQEARTLRNDLRDRELEVEKLTSELDSKKDLVRALRQQLDDLDQLKAAARQHDKKIFEQQHELDRKQHELDRNQDELERATQRIASLQEELEAVSAESADVTAVDNAELVALKSELDARKTMIKSLREDAERAASLQSQLEAKREAIGVLEDSIDQHVETIADLRKSVDAWKKKWQAAKGELVDADQTLAELPAFTDTEVEALKELERSGDGAPDRTVAIDMRDALKEARAQKAKART